MERREIRHTFIVSATENGEISAIYPEQVRAARGLLDWSRDQLSDAAGVPVRTLDRYEKGEGVPRSGTVAAIRAALEAAGVTFTNGGEPGVKLRKSRA